MSSDESHEGGDAPHAKHDHDTPLAVCASVSLCVVIERSHGVSGLPTARIAARGDW